MLGGMSRPVLYDYWRSSASYRVRIALHLKGIAFDRVPIDLAAGGQKSDDYRARNPQGFVPMLETEGRRIVQSLAIIDYLDAAYPEPALLPADPGDRAHVLSMAYVVACDIHPLNNSGTLAYLKNRLGHDQEAADEWYAHWVREGFETIEALIDPGPYAFGSRISLADVYLVPQVFNARRFNVPLDAYPKIAAVDAACAALKAFQDAAPANQPDAA